MTRQQESDSLDDRTNPGSLPDIDKILPVSSEEVGNAGLNMLMLLAHAYYRMLEATISLASWCTWLDVELNASYFWTIQNLTNLLKNNKELQDFPGIFKPILPDLNPSTVEDLEWQGMIGPEVDTFLSTVQKYVLAKGCYEPEQGSPGWIMVEMIRSGTDDAIKCANRHHEVLEEGKRQILELPLSSLSSPVLTIKVNAVEPQPPCAFHTPANATWADVRIKFVDGETVSIKCGDISGVFVYSEIGMIDGRNKKPTKQWELLRSFARGYGVLTWKDPGASPKNQKRRELLAKDLKTIFRVDGEPIILTEDKKGWRTVFSIEPDA